MSCSQSFRILRNDIKLKYVILYLTSLVNRPRRQKINENSNKTVVAPKKWFGSVYASWDTSDLIPEEWMIIDK